MNITLWFGAAIAAATLSIGASAQAPAGAPAGSNGLCKDGSYSTAATKSGACRGHKGVQTWYTAAAAPSAAAPSKTKAASTPTPSAAPSAAPLAATSRPAPAAVPRATPSSAPAPVTTAAPAPAAAQSAAPAGRRTSGTPTAAAPGGGPGMVWVNTASKVYHCSGTAFYGKTKAGKYVPEAAAKAEGDRADAGKPCSK